MKKIILSSLFVILFIVIAHYIYLRTKAPKESYPDDVFLGSQKNKTALVIVAHDDDAISSAGTLIQLGKQGWTVKELCFYHQANDEKLNQRNLQRQKDVQQVKAIEGLSEFSTITLPYRKLSDDALSYMPLPKDQFSHYYNSDTVLFYIRRFIDENKPSVIFTLDNNIGGYGHPDHVFVSQLVLDECNRRAADTSFSVKKIYQAVFTPSMNEHITKQLPVYIKALQVYGVDQPLPTVQLFISDYGSEKKKAMEAYSTEQNSLRKIWPFYHYYPAAVYFHLFNREFFHVINVKE